MSDQEHWDERYRTGSTPWDTGQPSSELCRVIEVQRVQPCRAIDIGCGYGTNAIWLAQQGFTVTAVDISSTAVERARERAKQACVTLQFIQADLLAKADLGGQYDFLFDRGCYHVLRQINQPASLALFRQLSCVGSLALVLTGNAREPRKPGPPTMSEAELGAELGQVFEFVELREIRFDPTSPQEVCPPLGWSCTLRRKAE